MLVQPEAGVRNTAAALKVAICAPQHLAASEQDAWLQVRCKGSAVSQIY